MRTFINTRSGRRHPGPRGWLFTGARQSASVNRTPSASSVESHDLALWEGLGVVGCRGGGRFGSAFGRVTGARQAVATPSLDEVAGLGQHLAL
jgi:hypothetical protein